MADEIIMNETENEEIPQDNNMGNTPTEDEASSSSEIHFTEDDLRNIDDKTLKETLKSVTQMMNVLNEMWEASKSEFGLTDANMRELYQYNLEHRKLKPDDYDEEANGKWDNYNGLDDISAEEVQTIFGETHSIIAPDHPTTVKRIKQSFGEFIEYICAVKEYKELNDTYIQYLELKEEDEMNELRKQAEVEEDPEKKAKMLSSIDDYYKVKTLGFLADPISEKDMERLCKAYTTASTLEYYIERARTKLKSLNISSKIILEISKFENRFMDEKYHKQSNILLLYFLSMVTFCRVDDPHDKTRGLIVSMTIALDNVIRKNWNEKYTKMVMDNIEKFEDQFLDRLS